MGWKTGSLLAAALLAVTVSGCLGGSDGSFEPGTKFKETGNVVRLQATVLDLLSKEIYPGMKANMWGFCFKPSDPNDEYSRNAIEYYPDQGVDTTESDWAGTCSTPGPILRVKQGDRVIVDFVNNHVHPHTIHWHGQYVPNGSDGVPGETQDSVKPGQSFQYDFIASRAGTLWYHCHVDTQFHVMQGLYGVIIVEPQDQTWQPKDIDREETLVVSTAKRDLIEATPRRVANPHADHQNLGSCGVTGEQDCQNPSVDITPDIFMFNGVSFPKTVDRDDTMFMLKPGERIRIRILNAGTTVEMLHPHGHDFQVVAIDGNPLSPQARYWVDTLQIGPAQRIDVILEGRENNGGVWVFHTHVNDHETNDGAGPGGMHTAIVYEGYEDEMHAFKAELPAGKPYQPAPDLPADVQLTKTQPLNTSSTSALDLPFTVGLPCAIQTFKVSATVDASSTAAQALNDMTLRILLPDGSEAAAVPFANQDSAVPFANGRYAEWVHDAVALHLEPGAYKAVLSGRAVDSVGSLNVAIDYYDDLAELAAAGNPCAAH